MKQDSLWMVALAALWGASFLFIRMAVPQMGPFPLIFARLGLAALVLLVVLLISQGRQGLQVWRQHWKAISLVGLFLTAVPFYLISWSTLSLTAGMASVLNATTPLMTILWAIPLAKERLTLQRVVGLGLGLVGVLVLAMGKGASFDWHSAGPLVGMLAATASYGWSSHMAKRWLSGLPPLVISTGSLTAGAIVIAPLAWANWPTQAVSSSAITAVVLLAIACTSAAYLIYYYLINKLGATRANTVTYLIPIFGVVWGALFLGEQLTSTMLLGGVLILAGVILLGWKRH